MSTIYVVPGSVVKIWLGIRTLNSPEVDSSFSHKLYLDQISRLLQGYMPIEQDYSMYSTSVQQYHYLIISSVAMVSRVGILLPFT